MKKVISFSVSLFTPFFAFAQGADAFTILGTIRALADKIIPLLITVALIIFFYGVIRYVLVEEPEEKKKMRGIIVKGLIGFFIMLSIWGLIGVIQRTFGVGNAKVGKSNIPTVDVY